ncbi:MAG TPA: hypothetical protein DCZ48_10815 [Methylococcaceae bacterium]|nr:hypothetical protein [Methylococcaceae bacterium]
MKLSALLIIVLLSYSHLSQAGHHRSERNSFSVTIHSFSKHSSKNETIPFNTLGISLLPNERFILQVKTNKPSVPVKFQAEQGKTRQLAQQQWQWQAPNKPGLTVLRLIHPISKETTELNVFVMVPASNVKNGILNGYQIGSYPRLPFKNMTTYETPKGFIEVTEANQDTKVSPHFTIGEFLSHQKGGFPKYLVLRERLLLKLEHIIETLYSKHFPVDSLHIMSGYRTPWYNSSLGQGPYSQHIYGGAADIYIDVNPKDGYMDDLNKDGKRDYQDAKVLIDIIEEMEGQSLYNKFVGGLARYQKTPHHGPFVHIDERGYKSRWND